MNRPTSRVAVIGAGSRANQAMYPALALLPDVEIAAICDIDEQRLNRTAGLYGVKARYGRHMHDYRRMVDEVQPDAVFAIGPPHVFYDIWMWCLEQGVDLCVEKPLGLNIHQARSLAAVAKENACITQVAFQRRYTPLVAKLRQECLSRGPITHSLCRFYKCHLVPHLDARDHMMDDTVHSIDTVRWMCGGSVVDVQSHTKRVQVPDINFISATLHFDNGSSGYIINSWCSGKRIFAVEMHAPGIFVEAEHETQGRLYSDGDVTGVFYDTKAAAGSDEFSVYTGVTELVRQFIDGCRTRRQPPTNFADAVETMRIADVILAQSLLSE